MEYLLFKTDGEAGYGSAGLEQDAAKHIKDKKQREAYQEKKD